MNQNILICNEGSINTDILCTLLYSEGFEVYTVNGRENMIDKIEREHIQLLIMDTEWSAGEGIHAIKRIRAESKIPIIVLSKNTEEIAKIAALNAGADDYVTMPCNLLELLARVKSQIRRYTQLASMCKNISSIYRVDDLEIDDVRRRVSVSGEEVKLTPIEYKKDNPVSLGTPNLKKDTVINKPLKQKPCNARLLLILLSHF